MSCIAIITARGGSKRIPQKNIKEFCGKPIIAYSIEASIKSGIFDEVMVSTDSEEIARISKDYGAAVPFMRSAITSSDYATTADVIAEVLDCYEKRGVTYDFFACVYPTAPFVTEKKICNAVKMLEGADAVVTVVKYSYPPQRSFVLKDGIVSYQYPQYEKARSQDLDPIYHDCGQIYVCRREPFLKYHTLIPPNTKPYIVPNEEVQDIDSYSDWRIAEAKYSMSKQGGVIE